MISIRCHTKQQQRICCIMRETESVIMTKNVNRYPKRMWRTAAVVRKTVRCHPSNRFFTPIHRFVSRFPTRHSCHRSEWRDTVRHHNDGGTLSIIMTENIKRHSERQRRICIRDEESRKKIKAISCELWAVSCELSAKSAEWQRKTLRPWMRKRCE